MNAFNPKPKSQVLVVVQATSQRVKVCDSGGPVNVRIRNASSADIFFDYGGSDITTDSTTGLSIGAGGVEVFTLGTKDRTPLWIAIIGSASSGVVFINPGEGI